MWRDKLGFYRSREENRKNHGLRKSTAETRGDRPPRSAPTRAVGMKLGMRTGEVTLALDSLGLGGQSLSEE